jgi:glycosyltransferase involved in cell wall biosynthesis
MRIAYILTSLGIGGAERQVIAIGERFAARGHSIKLIVLRPRLAEEWPTHLEVHYLGMSKSPLSFIAGLVRARRILRRFQPEIIHSHGFHSNIFARLLCLIGASPEPISTIHNVYEGGPLRMFAYRLTDPLSRLTTAVSSAAAERFVKLKSVPSQKCVVITNGVDTDEFSPDHDRRARVRFESVVHDAFLWFAAGRIVPAKDYSNLLRAFALVREESRAAELWIAGEHAYAEESARIRQLTSELQIEDSTKFLGLRRDLPALLDAADAFVLSSAWEGLPLALAEAMAMGKPVVATDVGGVRELVGDAGTLVPAGNSHALATAMLQVTADSVELRAGQGRAARRRIVAQFSIAAKTLEWEALYASLLKPTH